MIVPLPFPEEPGWAGLAGLFPEFPGPGRWLPLLRQHAELVASEAPRVRVTAVSAGEAVRRHYAESLELLRIADEAGWSGSVCDVGSGGGYPGLVIAALRPGAEVHLVEPLQKRARLLERLAKEMGLEKVVVHAVRAEEAGRSGLRDSCGLVTARAVAGLPELLEYTGPLGAPGALIALPKGSGLTGEIEAAAAAMKTLHVEVEVIVPMRRQVSAHIGVALLRKTGVTSRSYPRRPGTPARQPL